MIKANELRIGNWVSLLPSKRNVQLGAIDILGAVRGVYKYIPIPLTPEILDATAFENELDQFFTNTKGFKNGFIELEKDGDLYSVLFKQKNEDETWDVVLLKDVFYLHQLQNLYFALTGEELEIKLNVKESKT